MEWENKINSNEKVIDEYADSYLMGKGFELGEMRPIYSPDYSYAKNLVEKGKPCLKLVTTKKNSEDMVIIYINSTEAYMELISYNLEDSYHTAPEEGINTHNIDEVLDRLMTFV